MRKSFISLATACALVAGPVAAPAYSADESSTPGAVESSADTQRVFDAWKEGWTAIDSANPIDWLKNEVGGFGMMSSGDIEMSAQGSSQAASAWLLAFGITLVFGQIAQIIMSSINR
ncbi:hypothetical protein [Corynebacterium senegalense]|uniref:hypothetical protein n=1 Tax=Corynebacterium senegalense TaxID=2080750 RepID=UPI000E20538F|nr:hypothetical protein [Corynebacterium senegalense]